MACASTAGFHHGIEQEHVVGRGEVEARAAGLEAEQEQRCTTDRSWKRFAPRCALAAGSRRRGRRSGAARVEPLAHDREEARELREHERLVARSRAPPRASAGALELGRTRRRAGSSRPGWHAAWRSRSSISSTMKLSRLELRPRLALEQRSRGSASRSSSYSLALRIELARHASARSSRAGRAALAPWCGAARTAARVRAARRRASRSGLAREVGAELWNAARATEHAGVQELEQRPQLAEVVLDRRAAEREAMLGAQQARGLGGAARAFLIACASSSTT
jgi:hypothetical protein